MTRSEADLCCPSLLLEWNLQPLISFLAAVLQLIWGLFTTPFRFAHVTFDIVQTKPVFAWLPRKQPPALHVLLQSLDWCVISLLRSVCSLFQNFGDLYTKLKATVKSKHQWKRTEHHVRLIVEDECDATRVFAGCLCTCVHLIFNCSFF